MRKGLPYFGRSLCYREATFVVEKVFLIACEPWAFYFDLHLIRKIDLYLFTSRGNVFPDWCIFPVHFVKLGDCCSPICVIRDGSYHLRTKLRRDFFLEG